MTHNHGEMLTCLGITTMTQSPCEGHSTSARHAKARLPLARPLRVTIWLCLVKCTMCVLVIPTSFRLPRPSLVISALLCGAGVASTRVRVGPPGLCPWDSGGLSQWGPQLEVREQEERDGLLLPPLPPCPGSRFRGGLPLCKSTSYNVPWEQCQPLRNSQSVLPAHTVTEQAQLNDMLFIQ